MSDQQQEDEKNQPALDQGDGAETFAAEDEAQTEAWHDELPPEDDFHDTDEVQEQEDSDDDVIEEAPGEPYEEEEVTGDKKRGKSVLLGVLGVGVLLVGGMGYLQFGMSSDLKSTLMPMASVLDMKGLRDPAKAPATQPVATTPSTAEAPLTPKTAEADISSLYRTAQLQTQNNGATALPGSNASKQEGDKSSLGTSTSIMTLGDDEPATPPSAAKAVPAPVPTPVVAAKVEVVPVPVAPPAPAIVAVPPKAQVAKIETVPMPELQPQPAVSGVASSLASDMDSRVKMMGDQIKALQTSLDGALKQNDALMKKLDQMTQGGNSSLEDRLALLEKQVATGKTEATAKGRAVKDPAAIALQDDQSITEAPKEIVKKEAESAQVKPVVKKTKTATKAKAKAKASSPATSTKGERWTLRAATPEAAWVSKGDYTAELRRVAVGETLPSIGKIKEIRQSGEAWEVVGSKGILR